MVRILILFKLKPFLTLCILICGLALDAELLAQETSVSVQTEKNAAIPPALLLRIQEKHKLNPTIDIAMWLAIAERMSALNEALKPIIDEDSKRSEKDKQYILANSFTSFMYIMIAIGDKALASEISEVDFPPLIELFHLLIEYRLVTDHSSFDQMLSTIRKLEIKRVDGDLVITLFTQTGKTAEEVFKEGIPSPRFVISSVIFQNKAQFIFSELLLPKNASALAEFKQDSQKNFLTGGLVLMDKKKANILTFLNSVEKNTENNLNTQSLIMPMLIQGQGFAGHGYLKGFKLPSPSAKMETIYLLPGRDGTPAFVRAKSLFVKPFVAL